MTEDGGLGLRFRRGLKGVVRPLLGASGRSEEVRFFFFYGFFVLLLVSSMRGKDRRDDILFWGICGVPLWHRWRRGAW